MRDLPLALVPPMEAGAGVATIGDTLKARVFFHSGAAKDSVLFLGIERTSSSIVPFSIKVLEPALHNLYDLIGRKVTASRAVPGSVSVPER